MEDRAHRRALLALLVLAALALGRSLGFPFVNWDDPAHVIDNPLVREPLGQGLLALLATRNEGYPIPVAILSHALERALFGASPAAAHAINLLLHLANVLGAYLLFARLGLARRTAVRGSLLLALHPLVVEPVCWATGRKDLLALSLLLAALCALLGPRPEPVPRAARLASAQALALLAMLAKPSAIVAPLMLWLVARRRWPPSARRVALAVAPLALAAMALLVAGIRGEQAVGALVPRGAGAAALDVLGALALQLRHLLWPWELAAAYYRLPGDPAAWQLALAAAAVLGIVVLARAIGQRPGGALARDALLLGLFAYLPAAGLVPLGRWVADSYAYLALPFLAVGLVGAGEALWPPRLTRVAPPAWTAAALALALLSFAQAEAWSSSEALWRRVVDRYPSLPLPRARLALGQLHDGKQRAAALSLRDLRTRFPAYDDVICDQAWALFALGERAAGDRLLARGVAQGRAECVDRYLIQLVHRGSAAAEDPVLLRRALADALPRIAHADPTARERLAALLERARLPDLAARVRAARGAR